MTDRPLTVLRALGALLTYPSDELRAALPEIATLVRTSPLILVPHRNALLGLIELLTDADPLWTEENYGELFERGRATSLHLFEHVHGDTRARGDAMVELKAIYARAGFTVTANELPDYLPVVLEYLSWRERDEVRAMLGDCAHIVRRIGETLVQRGTPYSAVFEALLAITGESGLDREAAARRPTEPDDLDREWTEQPAFGPQTAAAPQDGRT